MKSYVVQGKKQDHWETVCRFSGSVGITAAEGLLEQLVSNGEGEYGEIRLLESHHDPVKDKDVWHQRFTSGPLPAVGAGKPTPAQHAHRAAPPPSALGEAAQGHGQNSGSSMVVYSNEIANTTQNHHLARCPASPGFSDFYSLSGRRSRRSYFIFLVFYYPVFFVSAGFLWGAILNGDGRGIGGAVALLVAAEIAQCTVGAQRCRDFGWTGWAILITLIPGFGWIFPFVMLFMPGTDGPNRYGPDPLRV